MKKKVTKEEQTQMNAKEFKKALEYVVKEKEIGRASCRERV